MHKYTLHLPHPLAICPNQYPVPHFINVVYSERYDLYAYSLSLYSRDSSLFYYSNEIH